MKPVNYLSLRRLRQAAPLVAILFGAWCGMSWAANPLADAPLFTSSAEAVRPNIMFILDNSGSMERTWLPDVAQNFGSSTYGSKSSQCNGMAYNPDVDYELPVDYLGTNKPEPSLAQGDPNVDTTRQRTVVNSLTVPAKGTTNYEITLNSQNNDGGTYDDGDRVTVFLNATTYFIGTVTDWKSNSDKLTITVDELVATVGSTFGSGTKVGLGVPKSAKYYKYKGSEPRLGFTYSGGSVVTTSNFYKQCVSQVGATPGSAVFDEVTVTAASPEARNYAIWAKYYRTRMDMMKAAVSLAFKGVSDRYRVGYTTINNYTSASNFLDIDDFVAGEGNQRQKFYEKVEAADPNGGTPLRGALSRAGQYYAKKLSGQTYDPVQYSCQRNFTILSTDGFWNTGNESSSYGPHDLAGANVGNRDNTLPPPMLDGNTVEVTKTDSWTTTTVTTVAEAFARVSTKTRTEVATTETVANKSQRTTYDAKKKVSIPASAVKLTNCSTSWWGGGSCTVEITLTAHGYATGDRVAIAGGAQAGILGTYAVTRMDANKFKYTTNYAGSVGTADYTVAPEAAASCAVGQGLAHRDLREDGTRSVSTTVTQSTTTYNVTAVATTTKTMTHTFVVVGSSPGVTTHGPEQTVSSTDERPVATATDSTTTVTVTPSTYTKDWTRVDTTCSAGSGAPLIEPITPPPPTTTAAAPVETTASADGTKTSDAPVVRTETSAKVQTLTYKSTGGVSDSLADVAAYYYQTDLRSSALNNCTGSMGKDVCENNVPGEVKTAHYSYGDSAAWQHMTTFTLGLGVSGLIEYDAKIKDYRDGSSAVFNRIVNRESAWPNPKAVAGNETTPENIDDLWHAAVNGRGQYFNAGDPTALKKSLNAALDTIKAVPGAASAASTSSLQPVQNDNDIYVAQFTTQTWIGDVIAYKIDPEAGTILPNKTWSAQAKLQAKPVGERKIFYSKPEVNQLEAFNYSNLKNDGLETLFDDFCKKTGANSSASPEQCADFDADDLKAANQGENLVNYLRGTEQKFYRGRTKVLGDIINASPLFIGKPAFRYTDDGYPEFASVNGTRTAVVLAAANDGMLHAFRRDTGDEAWAFIPSFVMKNLYKLADESYKNNHQYFVDGSPQVGDIFVGGAWKTIVVGGLNKGGRGYYALDVTDPLNPRRMWEFQHPDLGYTYGNPIITRRSTGEWVVVFASGYENINPGDGNGHLFVLDANTGALVKQVGTYTSGTTPAGTGLAPSGLTRINSWVDSELVNTSKRFYGGDELGNLWRFDIDNLVAPNGKALRLAQLTQPNGSPQAITTKPAVAEVEYNNARYPVVYVTTGSYLRTGDVLDKSVNSIYAIKDPLTDTPYGTVRNDSSFVVQEIIGGVSGSNSRPTRTQGTFNTVNWAAKSGWRADFPVGGERVSVNAQLALETLYVGSNLPKDDACNVGGDSFLYQFNINNGQFTSSYVGNVLVQGLTIVQLTTGAAAGSIVTIITRSDGTLQTDVGNPPASGGALRRTSWRELVD